MVIKITHGWVLQEFDDDGEFCYQEFNGENKIEYTDEDGNKLKVTDEMKKLSHPFDMKN